MNWFRILMIGLSIIWVLLAAYIVYLQNRNDKGKK